MRVAAERVLELPIYYLERRKLRSFALVFIALVFAFAPELRVSLDEHSHFALFVVVGRLCAFVVVFPLLREPALFEMIEVD